MKLILITLTVFIFFWIPNIESPKFQKDGMYYSTAMKLEKNWNKDFIGLWVNINEEKPGITKCKISLEDNQYAVQMWGACQPQDCDWGEIIANNVEKGATKFELLWNNVTFAESTITYELVDNKLKMTHKRHFKDNSGRPDNTLVEYFKKQ